MTASPKKNLTLPMAAIFLFYWGGFAAVMAFTSLYLLKTGCSNGEVGLTIALGSAAAALLQPLLSAYADRDESPSVKTFLALMSLLLSLAGGLVLLFGTAAMKSGSRADSLLCALFYGLSILLLQLMMPFLNALGMESLNQGFRLNFGLAEACGSAGYALLAYLLGILADERSPHLVPIFIAGSFFCALLLLLLYPFRKVPKAHGSDAGSARGAAGFFGRYPRFTAVVFGLVLIYTGHTVISSFILQIITPKGGGSPEMGAAAAICAVLELLPLVLFAWISRKIRGDRIVQVSAVFFSVKVLFTWLAPTVLSFYLVQIFQIGAWGLMVVGLVYYVNAAMAPGDVVKGQGYAAMAYTVGSVAGALLGGWLLDAADVDVLMLVSTLISSAGTVLVVLFAKKKEGIS